MKQWTKYKGLAALAMLTLVAPVFVWQYGVSDTVGRWRVTIKLRRQITELQGTHLHGGERHAIPLSATDMISSGLMMTRLVPPIEAEGLRIEHFSRHITTETEGVRLATGQLSVCGTFVGIVKLLRMIECELPECKIIAVRYRSTKPRIRGAEKTLTCTIYIQQITTINRL